MSGKGLDRVEKAAHAAGAKSVEILPPPHVWAMLGGNGLPWPGWDVADGVPPCHCAAEGLLDVASRRLRAGKRDLAARFVDAAMDAATVCLDPASHADRLAKAADAISSAAAGG